MEWNQKLAFSIVYSNNAIVAEFPSRPVYWYSIESFESSKIKPAAIASKKIIENFYKMCNIRLNVDF